FTSEHRDLRAADVDADEVAFHRGCARLSSCESAREEARPIAPPTAAPRAAPARTSDGQCLAAQIRSTAAVAVIAPPMVNTRRQAFVRGARKKREVNRAAGPATWLLGKDCLPSFLNRVIPGRGREVTRFNSFAT